MDADTKINLDLLNSRYNNYVNIEIRGTEDRNEISVEYNDIKKSALQFINTLPENLFSAPSIEMETSSEMHLSEGVVNSQKSQLKAVSFLKSIANNAGYISFALLLLVSVAVFLLTIVDFYIDMRNDQLSSEITFTLYFPLLLSLIAFVASIVIHKIFIKGNPQSAL